MTLQQLEQVFSDYLITECSDKLLAEDVVGILNFIKNDFKVNSQKFDIYEALDIWLIYYFNKVANLDITESADTFDLVKSLQLLEWSGGPKRTIQYDKFTVANIYSDMFYEVNCNEVTISRASNEVTSCVFMRSTIRRINLPEGLNSVGNSWFRYCHNLTEVRLPDSVKVIESYAFDHSAISTINLENILKIGGAAFYYCKNLTGVVLNQKIEEIDWGAFEDANTNFFGNDLKISSKVQIGNSAFNGIHVNNFYIDGVSKATKFWSFSGKYSWCYEFKVNNIYLEGREINLKTSDDNKILFYTTKENTLIPILISIDYIFNNVYLPKNITQIPNIETFSGDFADLIPENMKDYSFIDTLPSQGINSEKYVDLELPEKLKYVNDRAFISIPNVKTIKFTNLNSIILGHTIFTGNTSGLELIEFPDNMEIERMYVDTFKGLDRKVKIKYKGNYYKPSEMYSVFKQKLVSNATYTELFRVEDKYRTLVARTSSRVPAGMLAVSFKSKEGLQTSDAPIYFKTEEEAKQFLDKSYPQAVDYKYIHKARLRPEDLKSGFSEFNTPYGKVLIQNWRNIKYAKEVSEDLDLFEAFTPVTDKLKKLINECVKTLVTNGFNLPIGADKKPALKFKLGDKSRALGSAYYPRREHNGNYLVVLSKYIEDISEDAIKNTIYHELGHIICYMDELEKGYIYLDSDGDAKISGNTSAELKMNRKNLAGHGPVWQDVMQRIAKITGQTYQRLADAEKGRQFRDAVKDKYKYFFKCENNCGNKLKYTRMTDFVKNYNKKDKMGNPIWWCPRCEKQYGKRFQFVPYDGGEE